MGRDAKKRFEEFHHKNPDVYRRLVKMALELASRGYQTYGMKGLFEVLRWEEALRTNGSVFKLDNNFTAYYARRIMLVEPRLKGFFKTRGK